MSQVQQVRLPVRRLRSQLLLAFALVALVALLAAGGTVVWLMLGYRTQVTALRLREAGASAGAAAFALQRQAAAPDALAAAVASQVPLPAARVLVLDAAGTVVADEAATDTGGTQSGTLVGRRLAVPAPGGRDRSVPPLFGGPRQASPADRVVLWRGGGQPGTAGYVFVAAEPQGPSGPGERGAFSGPGRGPQAAAAALPAGGRVVLAVPARSLPSAWEELAPGLLVAAAVALCAAAAVAWWLAGSIAGPIRAVTQAAARIARGEPHQPISEAAGVDEVADLAHGFNVMAREVERSHRTLRDFVADASHELRTPLTAIQGFSQAVADGVLEAPEPTRDAAALIHREADRMRRLVEDLLLLSRMEARDRAPAGNRVDLAELLDILVQRTTLAARDRQLHVLLDVPEHLAARGDAGQLEHLFGNLIDNAAKYAPDGATVTVRAAPRPPAPGPGAPGPASRRRGEGTAGAPPAILVSVHNTGSYIPPEDLPHVFDRFYRADKSRSRDVAGSGLGLAIAKEIADRHGGAIRAESDPQTGTTFTVTLPAAPAAPASLPRQASPTGPAAPAAAGADGRAAVPQAAAPSLPRPYPTLKNG